MCQDIDCSGICIVNTLKYKIIENQLSAEDFIRLKVATGPYIMGYVLTGGLSWNSGYRIVSVMQIVLSVILFFSLPLWKKRNTEVNKETGEARKPKALSDVLRIRGAKVVLPLLTNMVCAGGYQFNISYSRLWGNAIR